MLTVSDVKVMHIPPKPFRASAMNISTDRAAMTKAKCFYGVGREGRPLSPLDFGPDTKPQQ